MPAASRQKGARGRVPSIHSRAGSFPRGLNPKPNASWALPMTTKSIASLLMRPPFLFVKMYFVRLGFLDGIHGFVLSVLSSAYVFSKYAKLWELQHGSQQPPEE